jgi:hypothetical protein
MGLCTSNITEAIKKRTQILADDVDMFVISQNRDVLEAPIIQDILKGVAGLGAQLAELVFNTGFTQITNGVLGKILTTIMSKAVTMFTYSVQGQLFLMSMLVGNLKRELQLRRCFYNELLYYLNSLERILVRYEVSKEGNTLLRQRILASKKKLDTAIRYFLRVEHRLQSPYAIFDDPSYRQALENLDAAIKLLAEGDTITTKEIQSRSMAETAKRLINERVNHYIADQKQIINGLAQAGFAIARRVPIPIGSIQLFKDSLYIKDPMADDFTTLLWNDPDISDIKQLFTTIERAKGLVLTNEMVNTYIAQIATFSIDYEELKKLAKLLFDILHPQNERLINVSEDMGEVLADKG